MRRALKDTSWSFQGRAGTCTVTAWEECHPGSGTRRMGLAHLDHQGPGEGGGLGCGPGAGVQKTWSHPVVKGARMLYKCHAFYWAPAHSERVVPHPLSKKWIIIFFCKCL